MNKYLYALGLVILTTTLAACLSQPAEPTPTDIPPSPEPPPPTETIPATIQADFETYLSETYSFNYPRGYTITEPIPGFPVLTIEKAGNKRLEIFQMIDFGDRPWGFTGEESQEDIDGYVPKEKLTVGNGDKEYDVWLFYTENDDQTITELNAIYDSIVIK